MSSKQQPLKPTRTSKVVTNSSTVQRTQPRSSLNNSTAELNSSSHAAPAHSPPHSGEENDSSNTTIPVHPTNPKETSSILGRLSPTIPTSSPLYQILANPEYSTIYDISASKLNTNDKFLVARGIDDCCRSVPHSITTYYINLLVVLYTRSWESTFPTRFAIQQTAQTSPIPNKRKLTASTN